jgi:isopenicillin N synthase-like dioxygenase
VDFGLVSYLSGSITVQFGRPVAMHREDELMTYAIPVIDLRAASAGNTSQLGAVRAATEELGVLQVINHGVPPDLIGDLSARTARLLGLPQAEKAKLASPHPHRGWRQWPDDFGRLELERFNVARYDDIGAARAAGLDEEYLGLYAHANVWPTDDPGLREVAFRYIEASLGLAKRMLWLYGRAQGLRENTFALGSLPHLRLTVNEYPTWAYPEAPDEDKLLLLEHVDDSAVTILAQQGDYEGLQIQAPDGSWLPVPIVPGALLVFSGSLLTQWSGGRMPAGRHRVVAGGTVTRRSTAVFVYPALDTVVQPLAQFAPLVADCDAEPILVWDHVKNRVASYLAEYGRPEQIAAWRDGTPYVAEFAENSAGR